MPSSPPTCLFNKPEATNAMTSRSRRLSVAKDLVAGAGTRTDTGVRTDATYGLADYYGFKTGELVTDDQRNVTRCASTVRMNWTGC